MYLPVPGLDADQWNHCLILILFNFTAMWVCMPILVSFEGFIYVIFNNMFMIWKIITNDIDELGKMLADKSISENEIKSKLTSIIQMHVDYNA